MRLPSANTMNRARKGAESTLLTDCSIYSRTKVDDGFASVDSEGLRDVSKCRVTKLGETQLSDAMRARNVAHFEIALPADSLIAVGERVQTTWTPEGSDVQTISIEIVEVNTPRQISQLLVLAIGYLIA